MEEINKLQSVNDKYKLNVGDFKVTKQINHGGFGSVYLVKNKETGENMAAKVIANHNIDDYITKANREISILIHCQNPTIIKFYGYSLIDFHHLNNVTIFMKYAPNGSLDKVLSKAKLSNADPWYSITVKQIFLVGIAYGMMILHRHHCFHRDLKPENILIDENFYPLIADFGLSKYFETGRTQQSIQCGTPAYMAPEVILGKNYNEKADIYSYGIIAYEIFTDQDPYPLFTKGIINQKELEKKIAEENYRPEFKDKSKPCIQRLIKRCLSNDPQKRPSFKDIFMMLAYNFDGNFGEENEEKEDYDENKYYLDGADIETVKIYAEDIDIYKDNIIYTEIFEMKKKYRDEMKTLKKDNQELKETNHKLMELLSDSENKNEEMREKIINVQNENEILQRELKTIQYENNVFKYEKERMQTKQNLISIKEFNNLSLNIKLYVISTFSNGIMASYFKKIYELLLYFMRLRPDTSDKYIEIIGCNQEQSLIEINQEEQIKIPSNITKFLYESESFDSQDFIEILTKFKMILIEISFATDSENIIYNKVLNIKTKYSDKIQIGLIIGQNDAIGKDFNQIDSIEFDTTVKIIPNNSFNSFTKLKRLIFPKTVEKIGDESFYNCRSIEQLIIPPSVYEISQFAFKYGFSLKIIDIPPSVNYIGQGCFAFCKSLEQIKIPSSITQIIKHTFYCCSSLNKVVVPMTLKKIGFKAFYGCTALDNIQIPQTTKIKDAFNENTRIDYL